MININFVGHLIQIKQEIDFSHMRDLLLLEVDMLGDHIFNLDELLLQGYLSMMALSKEERIGWL